MSETHVQLPSDPEAKEKLRRIIGEAVIIKQKVADIDAALKDTIATAAKDFDIPKPLMNKLVTTAFKCNYEAVQADNESFEYMYESLMRGKTAASDGDAE